jgi:Flp pilus assembly protein TadD
MLAACSTTPRVSDQSAKPVWVQKVVSYQSSLPLDHPDRNELVLAITPEMKDQVTNRFSLMPKHQAAKEMALWLLDENGHNMVYDVEASLTPVQSFAQRKGNCLSFTLLLAALTSELGIDLKFNSVDIPDTYGMDPDLGMIYYRHVNGVMDAYGRRQIFDLAMELYDTGYPQRYISEDQALGLLQNNRAIALLGENKITQALHPMKLALSLSPDNADLWVNYGVILKRAELFDQAEKAFNYAMSLNRFSAPAASNLERFYVEQGDEAKASVFRKRADRARQRNPYYHYQIALEKYQEELFNGALKATNKAIMLHNKDPRFHELKSLISQHQHKYSAAYKSLEKAYALASDVDQKVKYANKAALLNQQAFERFKKRGGLLRNNRTLREMRPDAQMEVKIR